jgi:hypothetical protein
MAVVLQGIETLQLGGIVAHKRKDTYANSPEHWKHLRPENRRRVAKSERRAARTLIDVDRDGEVDRTKQRRPRRYNS